MKCFAHNPTEAVAVCRACGKGVCPQCAVELDYGLVCQTGPCKAKAEAFNTVMEQNAALAPNIQSRFTQDDSRFRVYGYVAWLAAALGFLTLALGWLSGGTIDRELAGVSAVCAVLGYVCLTTRPLIARAKRNDSKN
jgi:hypothetical protein